MGKLNILSMGAYLLVCLAVTRLPDCYSEEIPIAPDGVRCTESDWNETECIATNYSGDERIYDAKENEVDNKVQDIDMTKQPAVEASDPLKGENDEDNDEPHEQEGAMVTEGQKKAPRSEVLQSLEEARRPDLPESQLIDEKQEEGDDDEDAVTEYEEALKEVMAKQEYRRSLIVYWMRFISSMIIFVWVIRRLEMY